MLVVEREITLQANTGQLDRRPPRFRGQSLRGREVPKVVPVLIDARDFGADPEVEETFQADLARSDQVSQLWRGYGKLHRSEEHTSELQSLMRISYAVFCLKKKKKNNKLNRDK